MSSDELSGPLRTSDCLSHRYDVIHVGDRRVLMTAFLSADTSIYAPANTPTVIPPAEAAVAIWNEAKAALGYTPDVHLPMTHQLVPEDKAFCLALAKHKELGPRTPIVLGAHEHEVYIDSCGGAKIIKTGADAEEIGYVDIWWGTDGVMHSKVELVPGCEFDEEPEAKKFCLEQEDFVRRVMSAPLMPIPAFMSSKTVRHSPSGVATLLLTQMLRGFKKENVELCVVHGGSVRAGKEYQANTTFTMGDLFAEFAFDGPMAIILVKGSILQASTANTRNAPKPAPDFLHFDEGVVIEPEKHAILSVGGVPFDPDKMYKIAINQLLLTGLNVIEPLMSYVRANVKVPTEESCRLSKNVVIEVSMKDVWRNLIDFQSFDEDGTGAIEEEEVRAGIKKFFTQVATRPEGISVEEVAALIQKKQGHLSLVEQLVKTLDTNGDGYIDQEEMLALSH